MFEVTQEIKNLFIKIVKNTYSLNEKDKNILIGDIDKISFDDIKNIIDILDNYENLIKKDSFTLEEKKYISNLDYELNDILNKFNF